MSPQDTGKQVDQDLGNLTSYGNEPQDGFPVKPRGFVVPPLDNRAQREIPSCKQLINRCIHYKHNVYFISNV